MGGPVQDPSFQEPPLRISGDAARYDHRDGNDDYSQARALYRLLPMPERQRLHRAIAGSMAGVPREIIDRQLGHFEKVDPAYAKGVRDALRHPPDGRRAVAGLRWTIESENRGGG